MNNYNFTSLEQSARAFQALLPEQHAMSSSSVTYPAPPRIVPATMSAVVSSSLYTPNPPHSNSFASSTPPSRTFTPFPNDMGNNYFSLFGWSTHNSSDLFAAPSASTSSSIRYPAPPRTVPATVSAVVSSNSNAYPQHSRCVVSSVSDPYPSILSLSPIPVTESPYIFSNREDPLLPPVAFTDLPPVSGASSSVAYSASSQTVPATLSAVVSSSSDAYPQYSSCVVSSVSDPYPSILSLSPIPVTESPYIFSNREDLLLPPVAFTDLPPVSGASSSVAYSASSQTVPATMSAVVSSNSDAPQGAIRPTKKIKLDLTTSNYNDITSKQSNYNLQQKNNVLQKNIEKSEKINKTLAEQISHLLKKLNFYSKIEQKNNGLEQKNQCLEQKNNFLEKRIKELEKRIKELEKSKETLAKQISVSNSSSYSVIKECNSTLEKINSDLKRNNRDLEKKNKSLEEEVMHLRKLLSTASASKK